MLVFVRSINYYIYYVYNIYITYIVLTIDKQLILKERHFKSQVRAPGLLTDLVKYSFVSIAHGNVSLFSN